MASLKSAPNPKNGGTGSHNLFSLLKRGALEEHHQLELRA